MGPKAGLAESSLLIHLMPLGLWAARGIPALFFMPSERTGQCNETNLDNEG